MSHRARVADHPDEDFGRSIVPAQPYPWALYHDHDGDNNACQYHDVPGLKKITHLTFTPPLKVISHQVSFP
jgi:hypothetical protein